MASCDLKIKIPGFVSGPEVLSFGQLGALNASLGVAEENVVFRLQTLDPILSMYVDSLGSFGVDGYFKPSDESGNTVFSSETVTFTEDTKRLIIESGSNEGTYQILEAFGNYAYIVKDNNPNPPPNLPLLFETFSLLIGSAEIKSPLNPNYGKDLMDQIIKLFDGFMPFITMYKFFLPALKLIVCIIEVLCAIPNPAKITAAMQRLFRDCIPPFLALFPIMAIIVMIINIIILVIQIILYLIMLIISIIELILENINILLQAILRHDAESILAAVSKIGRVICLLQNIFVVLLLVNAIFQIFKDLLNMLFAIPPCDSSDNSSFQNCCTPDVCPQFVKNGDFSRTTGSVLYTSACNSKPKDAPPELEKYLSAPLRSESFQLYDDKADLYEEFANIIHPKDPTYDKFAGSDPTIFFPTDASYSKDTPPSQAPYLVDIKFLYKPSVFGRDGYERFVIFKNCIVTNPTSLTLSNPDGTEKPKPFGVIKIAGGLGFEEDGSKINGYSGAKATKKQATLETFFFLDSQTVYDETLTNIENKDYLSFEDLEYTFKINHKVLVSKNLITYSCLPEVSQDRTFSTNVFGNELNGKIAELQNFNFPNITKAIDCVNLSIDAFRNNVSVEGAETLRATSIACLQQLKEECEEAVKTALPLAFDPYKSDFSVQQEVQFTTDTIKVNVELKETSGSLLTNLLPASASDYIAKNIVASASFGKISEFKYNGKSFEAEISSESSGSGSLQVSFDNKKISRITPEDRVADLSKPLTISVKELNYQFIYTQSNLQNVSVGTGDASDGAPIRDGGDVSRTDI